MAVMQVLAYSRKEEAWERLTASSARCSSSTSRWGSS
ncbi:MAG TPA: hypothetical protein VNV62_09985, partial [Trebonia sp.]|nr:hypothetical protein [Trebonia sp.]